MDPSIAAFISATGSLGFAVVFGLWVLVKLIPSHQKQLDDKDAAHAIEREAMRKECVDERKDMTTQFNAQVQSILTDVKEQRAGWLRQRLPKDA